jgi:hypothetical protein
MLAQPGQSGAASSSFSFPAAPGPALAWRPRRNERVFLHRCVPDRTATRVAHSQRQRVRLTPSVSPRFKNARSGSPPALEWAARPSAVSAPSVACQTSPNTSSGLVRSLKRRAHSQPCSQNQPRRVVHTSLRPGSCGSKQTRHLTLLSSGRTPEYRCTPLNSNVRALSNTRGEVLCV